MKKRKIILFAILILILYLAGNTISICMYGMKDERCEADVAIVLGAAAYDETVSPVYRERLNHGIYLYQQGYVKKIIVTGGLAEGNKYSDAYAAKQYVIDMGVPEEDIQMEETSTITQENLENAKRIMDENAYEKAIIVSDPLHMKRAMLLAKDTGMEAYSSPTPQPCIEASGQSCHFWHGRYFFILGIGGTDC